MNLDSDDIISDFVHGDKIYLNSASVSLMPVQSVDAMREFLVQYSSIGPDSASSGSFVAEKFRSARKVISQIINSEPDEVVMTQSVTDGVNLVASGLSVSPSSEIIIRGLSHEHHANFYPWLKLGKKCRLRNIEIDKNGFFDLDCLQRALNPDTKLVALSHALYNTGAILPVERAGHLASERQVPYFVDAAQTVGCTNLADVKRIRCDFMSFNGSKWLCGPMGTGIFYCRRQSGGLLEPAAIGGESAILHEDDRLAYRGLPYKFQTGFRNYVGLVGLESSARYVSGFGLDNIRKKITGLAGLLRQELQKIPGVTLYGPAEEERRTSIVSFSIDGLEPKYVAERLDKDGVVLAVREIMERKIVRASPHLFNSEHEMLRVAELVRGL